MGLGVWLSWESDSLAYAEPGASSPAVHELGVGWAPEVPALGRQRQENQNSVYQLQNEFEANLDYIRTPPPKKKHGVREMA